MNPPEVLGKVLRNPRLTGFLLFGASGALVHAHRPIEPRKEAADARRAYEYVSKNLSESDAWNATHADENLSVYVQNRSEHDVFRAQLAARGKNPNPPAE